MTHRKAKTVEWPTVALIATTHAAILGLTAGAGGYLPLFVLVPLLAAALALYSSLQHEVLHGHPFPSVALSEATVFPAWGLWLPYERFKATHLTHHFDPNLTDPFDDPESNYYEEEEFRRKYRYLSPALHFNNTLLGRIVLGPAIGVLAFLRSEMIALARGDRAVWRAWALHVAGLVPVIAWLRLAGGIPASAYGLAVYLSVSILKVRTFLEHRAHERAGARTVLIEDRGILAFLFLNNNLHAVHHAHPGLAWYRIPARYRARREAYVARTDSYVFRSYGEIFRRFLFRAKDPLVHPLWNRTNRNTDSLHNTDYTPKAN